MRNESEEYKPHLNGRLAKLLVQENLNASVEESVGNGRMVKVRFDHHTVAIVCRNFGFGKHISAIRDAIKRIDSIDDEGFARFPDAHVAVALVYPSDVEFSELNFDSKIEYVIIHPTDIIEKSEIQLLKDLQWSSASVKSLVQIIRRLNDDLGNPDYLARKLNTVLNNATSKLSLFQRQNIARALNLPADSQDQCLFAAAKRGLLVIASAAMFHARLGPYLNVLERKIELLPDDLQDKPWPPQRLEDLSRDSNIIGSLMSAWRMILSVDYGPIFKTAIAVLDRTTRDPNSSTAISEVVCSAHYVANEIEGIRHDLLGRIFHAILDKARYDGSFYTTTAAATLLAGITIRDRDDVSSEVKNMKIVDPACGTGTLLMAAAERLKDVVPDMKESTLVEDVLTGYDINLTATHMAATTLGLLSPTTQFQKLNIYLAAFGKTKSVHHSIRTGSLEIFDEDQSLKFHEWPSSVSQFESGVSRQKVDKANLVIMNPPFTRNSLRHDQLGKRVENLVKDREKKIFAKAPVKVSFSSSGPAFLVLAEHLCKKKDGTVALIQPLVAAISPSGQSIREFMAKEFHIETVVTAHDPKRFWFSENTSISEMLVVMRRGAIGQPTRIINLAKNPETVQEALQLSESIRKNDSENIAGVVQMWPYKRVKEGDWSGVQFYSPFLTELFMNIREGKIFDVKPLNMMAKVESSYRSVRSAFKITKKPDRHGRRALWHFKTDITNKMNATTDTLITAKINEDKAQFVWDKRSRFLLPVKVQPNLAKVIAVRSSTPTLGSRWMTVEFVQNSSEIEKAVCVYLNSTVGLVAMLGVRTPKKPCYPDFSLEGVSKASIPCLDNQKMNDLSLVFDKYADTDLGKWSVANNSVRQGLDREVSEILGIDHELISVAREELAREPMCTNRRYE